MRTFLRRLRQNWDLVLFAVAGLVAFLLVEGCALSIPQKIEVCQQSIQVLVLPECMRLVEVGEQYVSLCIEVAESAIVACDAGFSEDPVIMCARLSSAASQCEGLVPGDNARNIETCERVLRASHIACTLAVSSLGGS